MNNFQFLSIIFLLWSLNFNTSATSDEPQIIPLILMCLSLIA